MMPIALSKFIYNKKDVIIPSGSTSAVNSVENVADMHQAVVNNEVVNWVASFSIAAAALMLLYVFILDLMWFIERRGIVPELFGIKVKPFTFMTFGKGDSSELSGGKMVVITLIAVVTLLSILSGIYFDIVVKIVSLIFNSIREVFI